MDFIGNYLFKIKISIFANKNYFYCLFCFYFRNYAIEKDTWMSSTIVAGTAGQHYVDNIFFNPENDYEIMTVNRSLLVYYSNNT